VSLAEARDLCDDARRSLRHGSNPHETKQEILARKEEEAGCTFDELARQWLAKMEKARSSGTQAKVAAWLDHDVLPFIGTMRAPA
jgi:hypothetical protein